MENPAPFDLNRAVLQWREQLAASPAFRGEDVDELENHLRDAIASLELLGLNPQEAFTIARHRLGHGDKLQSEFGKVNGPHVWLDRALWMIVGYLVICALTSCTMLMLNLATFAMQRWTSLGGLIGPANLALHPFLFVIIILLTVCFAKKTHRTLSRLVRWSQSHPVRAALGLVALLAVLALLGTGASVLLFQQMPGTEFASIMKWRFHTSILSALVWPGALCWLLVRNARSKPSSLQA